MFDIDIPEVEHMFEVLDERLPADAEIREFVDDLYEKFEKTSELTEKQYNALKKIYNRNS